MGRDLFILVAHVRVEPRPQPMWLLFTAQRPENFEGDVGDVKRYIISGLGPAGGQDQRLRYPTPFVSLNDLAGCFGSPSSMIATESLWSLKLLLEMSQLGHIGATSTLAICCCQEEVSLYELQTPHDWGTYIGRAGEPLQLPRCTLLPWKWFPRDLRLEANRLIRITDRAEAGEVHRLEVTQQRPHKKYGQTARLGIPVMVELSPTPRGVLTGLLLPPRCTGDKESAETIGVLSYLLQEREDRRLDAIRGRRLSLEENCIRKRALLFFDNKRLYDSQVLADIAQKAETRLTLDWGEETYPRGIALLGAMDDDYIERQFDTTQAFLRALIRSGGRVVQCPTVLRCPERSDRPWDWSIFATDGRDAFLQRGAHRAIIESPAQIIQDHSDTAQDPEAMPRCYCGSCPIAWTSSGWNCPLTWYREQQRSAACQGPLACRYSKSCWEASCRFSHPGELWARTMVPSPATAAAAEAVGRPNVDSPTLETANMDNDHPRARTGCSGTNEDPRT